MFKIVHLDGKEELPTDDIYYILGKNGPYLKKKLGLIESLTPVKEISILGEVKPYAKMTIPKIPGKSFGKVMKFFKKVYQAYSSEAIVLLYLNPTTKIYKIYIPHQKVNGASVDYVKGVHIDDHIQIGTIHSHANFSAFHSGVDDNDEEHFDGLHITIGNNMDENPSISASIVSNGMRFKVGPEEYIDNLDTVESTPYFPHMFKPGFNVTVNGVKEYTSTVKSKLEYKLNIKLEEKDFNEKWLEKIEDNRPKYPVYGTGFYKGGYFDKDNFDKDYSYHGWGYFDEDSKEDGTLDWYKSKFGFDKKKKKKNKKKGKFNDRTTIKFPYTGKNSKTEVPVYVKPKYDPCSTCVFKNYKTDKPNIQELKEKEIGIKKIIINSEDTDISGFINEN